MTPEARCHYSVVRYVPDPIRNEPRNIGVLVLCPERGFGAGRFSLGRAGLSPASPRYRFLQSIMENYKLQVARSTGTEFDARLESQFDLADLRRLHEEATNLIQFTEPLPAPGEPEKILNELYKDFVAPRHAGRGAAWNRSAALQVFRQSFRKRGLEAWIREPAVVGPKHEPPYVFDFGVGNGTWRALVLNASFRIQDQQKPEERAAWLTFAVRSVRRETEADALLFVERGEGRESAERYRRIEGWTREAGVMLHDAEEAEDVARQLADSTAGAHGAQLELLEAR